MPKHPSSGKYAIVGLGVIAGQQPDNPSAWSRRRRHASPSRMPVSRRKDIVGAIDLRRIRRRRRPRQPMSTPITRVLGLNNNFYFICGRGGALGGPRHRDRGHVVPRPRHRRLRLPHGRGDRLVAGAGSRASTATAAWRMRRSAAIGARRWATCARSATIAGWRRATWRSTARRAGNSAPSRSRSAPGRCLNPEAKMYGRPITIEDHQNSPLVAEPYHLLDISLVSDGAVAFILTTRGSRQGRQEEAGLCAGTGLRRGLFHAVVGEEEFHAHGGRARQGSRPSAGRHHARRHRLRAVLRLLHRRGAVPDRGLRILQEGRGRRIRGDGRDRSRRQRSRSTPAAGCCPAIISAISPGLPNPFASCAANAASARSRTVTSSSTTGHGGELVSPGMCSIHTCTLLGSQP